MKIMEEFSSQVRNDFKRRLRAADFPLSMDTCWTEDATALHDLLINKAHILRTNIFESLNFVARMKMTSLYFFYEKKRHCKSFSP